MTPQVIQESLQPLFECCGKPLPEIGPLQDWTRLVAYPCAHWVDSSVAATASQIDPGQYTLFETNLLEHLPEVGSLQTLCVDEQFGVPKSGCSVWVLFTPANSTLNGWDSHYAEELMMSGLVRVELIEVVSKYTRHAWLKVRVLEVVTIPELIGMWTTRETCLPLPNLLDCGTPTCELIGDFAYSQSSADDCLQTVLCQRRAGRWILLMCSDWGYHRDYLEVGVRELSDEEYQLLRLPPAGS